MYMGIEVRVGNQWALIAASAISFKKMLEDAPETARKLDYADYRVKRIDRETYLNHLNRIKDHPGYNCPRCASKLEPKNGNLAVLHCEICKLQILQSEAI